MDTSHLVSGIVVGGFAGSVGGFLSGIALLRLNRLRNPDAKDLVRPSFHVPGALAGAIAGAITSQRASWLSIASGFLAFPAVLFVLVVVSLIVERVRR